MTYRAREIVTAAPTLKMALVGGGSGSLSIIDALDGAAMGGLGVELIGVADKDPEAAGV